MEKMREVTPGENIEERHVRVSWSKEKQEFVALDQRRQSVHKTSVYLSNLPAKSPSKQKINPRVVTPDTLPDKIANQPKNTTTLSLPKVDILNQDILDELFQDLIDLLERNIHEKANLIQIFDFVHRHLLSRAKESHDLYLAHKITLKWKENITNEYPIRLILIDRSVLCEALRRLAESLVQLGQVAQAKNICLWCREFVLKSENRISNGSTLEVVEEQIKQFVLECIKIENTQSRLDVLAKRSLPSVEIMREILNQSEALLKTMPFSIKLWRLRISMLMESMDFHQVETLLISKKLMVRCDPVLTLHLARILDHKGFTTQAIQEIDAFFEAKVSPIDTLMPGTLQEDCRNLLVFSQRLQQFLSLKSMANALYKSKKWQEALNIYSQCFRVHPEKESHRIHGKQFASLMYERACGLIAIGHFEQAYRELKKVLQWYPNHAQATMQAREVQLQMETQKLAEMANKTTRKNKV
jgi:tetratricopeptide (TPR) repeat protein